MDNIEVSDLEEGEILENDFCSPKNFLKSEENVGIRRRSLQIYERDMWDQFKLEENVDSLNLSNHRKAGYTCRSVKGISKLASKNKSNGKKIVDNNKFYIFDYMSSSDGEYKSDKSVLAESRHMNIYSYEDYLEERLKKKYSGHVVYGSAEDIMTQIDETICRKTRCNYKRRKSRDVKCSLGKIYQKTSPKELTVQLALSSQPSNEGKRRMKRKIASDSDSEVLGKFMKEDTVRRKRPGSRRKRKKDVYSDEVVSKKSEEKILHKKVRDFDEVRKSLLEKLKKQKESESKEGGQGQGDDQEYENSEIQEVEMLIKSTSDEDGLAKEEDTNAVSEGVQGQVVPDEMEKEGEEEMDIKQLRLIALASNKRKRENLDSSSPKTEPSSNTEDFGSSTEKRSEDDDGDLDRNELLLRAEALKTALLKKHQKRLNRLKGEDKSLGFSSDNDVAQAEPSEPEPVQVEERASEECKEPEGKNLSALDGEAFKENREVGSEVSASGLEVPTSLSDQVNKSETTIVSNAHLKKRRLGARGRKRKKKTNLESGNVKENKDIVNEMPEEDDRTLRSQLLHDLIQKKSLKKDLEKKSVLMDSVQASVNRPAVLSNDKPEVNLKPLPSVKASVPKKVNVPKGTKIPGVPKIPKPEIQRIIVHLGSDDSSDDEEEDSALQNIQTSVPKSGNEGQESSVVSRQTDEAIQAGYERSVELLLSQARKKIEVEMQKAQNKAVATPEAVYKHLPPSQRLEYIRLKQKIAERERLRKMKNNGMLKSSSGAKKQSPVESTVPKEGTENSSEKPAASCQKVDPKNSAGNKVGSTVTSSSSKILKLNKSTANGRYQISPSANSVTLKSGPRTVVNKNAGQTSRVAGSPSGQTNVSLVLPNQVLLSKLKLLLKKIKIEKTIEENYEKEITKLKNQLSLFEKKKSEQKFKIKKLAEESTKIYKVMQAATASKQQAVEAKEKKRKKVEEIKQEKEKKEETEKVEEIKEAENDSSKEVKVVEETKSEISKDLLVESGTNQEPNNDSNKINEVVSSETSTVSAAPELSEYNSPLYVFNKGSDVSERVDPNVIMCQFDLMGICKDEECTYQHFRTPS